MHKRSTEMTRHNATNRVDKTPQNRALPWPGVATGRDYQACLGRPTEGAAQVDALLHEASVEIAITLYATFRIVYGRTIPVAQLSNSHKLSITSCDYFIVIKTLCQSFYIHESCVYLYIVNKHICRK
jgi:hypothetical protein